ncbi:MAG: hypothetical protein NDJ94_04720 [Vicinamibacteria bacterium]|nr:hypothetical protein [Vicinamibacteria bacterium]
MNDDIEQDLVQLERAMRLLQIDWEKFFGGVDKRPPMEQRTRVEALLRRYASAEIRNATLRFRYQGLQARYNTFNELWNKKLRALEEGRPLGLRAGARPVPPPPPPPVPEALPLEAAVPAALAASERASARAEAPSAVRIQDASRDRAAVESLFQAFLEERRKTGESTAVKYESFEKLISQQAQRLSSERGAQAIDFRLETKDGKVSLKAKVVV